MMEIGTRGVITIRNHTLTGHEVEIVRRDPVTGAVTIRILKDYDAYRAGEILKYSPRNVRTLPPAWSRRHARPNPQPSQKPV